MFSWEKNAFTNHTISIEQHHIAIKFWRRRKTCNILKSLQGDYIWIEPISGREFDVAIGARVISAEGRRIQVKDDDNKVLL